MITRYKISDLAKDFNMPSIELINLLNRKFGISISETSVLVEEEIAVVFDMLTKEHTVRSFDDYFAIGAAERAAEAKKKQDEKDKKLADIMSSYLTNFAKYGNPNGDNLPIWNSTNKKQKQVMHLNENICFKKANYRKLIHTMFTNKAVGE